MPPRKRSKRTSSQEGQKMSTQFQASSPEVDELSSAPGTRDPTEPAGNWGGGVGGGSWYPLQMSDTEQGDIALETQQDSDSSDVDTKDT